MSALAGTPALVLAAVVHHLRASSSSDGKHHRHRHHPRLTVEHALELHRHLGPFAFIFFAPDEVGQVFQLSLQSSVGTVFFSLPESPLLHFVVERLVGVGL